jgi:hypothetical protein
VSERIVRELSEAVEPARPVLEGIEEARLEAYLQNLELKSNFRLSLGMSLVSEDDQYTAASLESLTGGFVHK